ncbi:MAG: hypothetical protein ACREQD_03725, partial [Candidatus Binataceae bacterium]
MPPSGLVQLAHEPAVRQKCLEPLLRRQAPHGRNEIFLQLSGELRFHLAGILAERRSRTVAQRKCERLRRTLRHEAQLPLMPDRQDSYFIAPNNEAIKRDVSGLA